MAVYGQNILPAFNSQWTLSDPETSSISAGIFSGELWDTAYYDYSLTDYNLSGTAMVSCVHCTSRFILSIYYRPIDSDDLLCTSVDIREGGISVEVPLQAGQISQLKFSVGCLQAGEIGAISFQLPLASDSSGSSYSGLTQEDATVPTFYAYPYFSGEREFAKGTTNIYQEIAFMNLRLNPVLENKKPVSAYVDIDAQVCLKSMPHYNSAGTNSNLCHVSLFHGTKMIAATFVECLEYKDTTCCLHAKLEASSCTILDTVQDVPLKLCIAPISPFCVVRGEQTYIKATGTILKASQYTIQKASITKYKRTYTGGTEYYITTSYPDTVASENVDVVMLYNRETPQTAYIVSSIKTYKSAEYTTHWYIHSVDMLGPFESDKQAEGGGITLRQTISSYMGAYDSIDPNHINKMRLAVITHISKPQSIWGHLSAAELGYQVSTNNNSVLRIQLTQGGVLSICNLDGTNSKVIDTNVIDFDVAQQGCNNFWYQHTDADNDDPVLERDTIGFTIAYIKEHSIHVATYPTPNNRNVTSTSVAYNSNWLGVYSVYPPNHSAQGDSGTYTYQKINLDALHLFGDGAGDGQTNFTLYFGLALYYTYTNSGTSLTSWNYGLLEYGMSGAGHISGTIGEGATYTDIDWYFACVNMYNLYYNKYWAYDSSLLPSTNQYTALMSESNLSASTELRILGADLTGGAKDYTDWESQCNFYLDTSSYTRMFWSSSTNQVVPSFHNSSTYCIKHLPSGELMRLDVYKKEAIQYLAVHYSLVPRMHRWYNVHHSSSDTQAQLSYRYNINTNTAYNVPSPNLETAYKEIYGSTYSSAEYTYSILADYQYGSTFYYTTAPSFIKGIVTLGQVLLPAAVGTYEQQYTGRNDFAFMGWLPMNTAVKTPS